MADWADSISRPAARACLERGTSEVSWTFLGTMGGIRQSVELYAKRSSLLKGKVRSSEKHMLCLTHTTTVISG